MKGHKFVNVRYTREYLFCPQMIHKRVWGWSSGGVYLCRTFWVTPGTETPNLQKISSQAWNAKNRYPTKFTSSEIFIPYSIKNNNNNNNNNNKQKHCHATLISLSLPAEATQFFSSGCQSIANAGPLCPTCWMKGELVWRLSHNYNKKDGKNASQVSRNLVPRGFSLFNMVSEGKLVTWFGCVTGSSLLPPL